MSNNKISFFNMFMKLLFTNTLWNLLDFHQREGNFALCEVLLELYKSRNLVYFSIFINIFTIYYKQFNIGFLIIAVSIINFALRLYKWKYILELNFIM